MKYLYFLNFLLFSKITDMRSKKMGKNCLNNYINRGFSFANGKKPVSLKMIYEIIIGNGKNYALTIE